MKNIKHAFLKENTFGQVFVKQIYADAFMEEDTKNQI